MEKRKSQIVWGASPASTLNAKDKEPGKKFSRSK